MIYKPSEKEQEYFLKQEAQRLRTLREKARADMEAAERQRLKDEHWMRCPKCGMELSEIEFKGVMVDACFSCGGMYFDAGEVEKVIAAQDPGLLQRLKGTLFGSGSTVD